MPAIKANTTSDVSIGSDLLEIGQATPNYNRRPGESLFV